MRKSDPPPQALDLPSAQQMDQMFGKMAGPSEPAPPAPALVQPLEVANAEQLPEAGEMPDLETLQMYADIANGRRPIPNAEPAPVVASPAMPEPVPSAAAEPEVPAWQEHINTLARQNAELQAQMHQLAQHRPMSEAEQLQQRAADMQAAGLNPSSADDVFKYQLYTELQELRAQQARMQQENEHLRMSARAITLETTVRGTAEAELRQYGKIPKETLEAVTKLAAAHAQSMSPQRAVKEAISSLGLAQLLAERKQSAVQPRPGPQPAVTSLPPSPSARANVPAFAGRPPAQIAAQLKAMQSVVPARGAGRFTQSPADMTFEALESAIFRSR